MLWITLSTHAASDEEHERRKALPRSKPHGNGVGTARACRTGYGNIGQPWRTWASGNRFAVWESLHSGTTRSSPPIRPSCRRPHDPMKPASFPPRATYLPRRTGAVGWRLAILGSEFGDTLEVRPRHAQATLAVRATAPIVWLRAGPAGLV